jgi:hypothetical protein
MTPARWTCSPAPRDDALEGDRLDLQWRLLLPATDMKPALEIAATAPSRLLCHKVGLSHRRLVAAGGRAVTRPELIEIS